MLLVTALSCPFELPLSCPLVFYDYNSATETLDTFVLSVSIVCLSVYSLYVRMPVTVLSVVPSVSVHPPIRPCIHQLRPLPTYLLSYLSDRLLDMVHNDDNFHHL